MTNNNSISLQGAGNFRFSAVRPDNLGASEYTLVSIAVDASTSVYEFDKELKNCVKSILNAAKKSARADNILVRLIKFNSNLGEIFGFKNLTEIDIDNLEDIDPSGATALFDASYEQLGSLEKYSQMLYDQEFDVNAALYVITDGEDNVSQTAYPKMIADLQKTIRRSERIESLISLLIGINTKESSVAQSLNRFATEAEFDQYVDAGDATVANLAKLAAYVSKSITSQSQALGSGSASQVLTF